MLPSYSCLPSHRGAGPAHGDGWTQRSRSRFRTVVRDNDWGSHFKSGSFLHTNLLAWLVISLLKMSPLWRCRQSGSSWFDNLLLCNAGKPILCSLVKCDKLALMQFCQTLLGMNEIYLLCCNPCHRHFGDLYSLYIVYEIAPQWQHNAAFA